MQRSERLASRRRESKDSNRRPKRQKTFYKEDLSCPTCGLSLKPQEAAAHLQLEIDKLYRIPLGRPVARRPNPDAVYTHSTAYTSALASPADDRSAATPTTCSTPPAAPDDSAGSIHPGHLSGAPCGSTTTAGHANGSAQPISSGTSTAPHPSLASGIEFDCDVPTSPSMNGAQPTSSQMHLSSAAPRIATGRRIDKERHAMQLERAKKVRAIRCSRTDRRRQQREVLADAEERTCPQCYRLLARQHFPQHVDHCVDVTSDESEGGGSDGEEGEDSLPQYEWCGQTRVRVTDVLRSQGQLHALGTLVVRGSEDDEVDVCNDTDFGPQQFFEEDARQAQSEDCDTPLSVETVSSSVESTMPTGSSKNTTDTNSSSSDPTNSSSNCSDDRLNGCTALLSREPSHTVTNASNGNGSNVPVAGWQPCNVLFEDHCQQELKKLLSESSSTRDLNSSLLDRLPAACSSSAGGPENPILEGVPPPAGCPLSGLVEQLMLKIKALEVRESASRTSQFKCSVCRDVYEQPLVSTVCWHVHCRSCWMGTIASKRQCPQCLAIFSISDLRRVFL